MKTDDRYRAGFLNEHPDLNGYITALTALRPHESVRIFLHYLMEHITAETFAAAFTQMQPDTQILVRSLTAERALPILST